MKTPKNLTHAEFMVIVSVILSILPLALYFKSKEQKVKLTKRQINKT